MSELFRGAGVALVTPFTEDNKVDFKSLEIIVDDQVKNGIDYLVVLGTTAETPTLSNEEKRDIVTLVKERSSGLPVVVGAGGNNTNKILHEIEELGSDGISGLLIVTPYYNKPTQEGLYRHYNEICNHSNLPIILYNVPSRTGVNLEAETVIRLAESSERFVAVKEASGSMEQIMKMIHQTPSGFSVISGDDMLALPMISLGGSGVISVIANALPAQYGTLIHKALQGDFETARQIQFELLDLFHLLFKEGNPGGIKALMNIQGRIKNILRLPLYKVGETTYNGISRAYQTLK